MFYLNKILALMIPPPLGPLLLIAFGLLLRQRRPRLGSALAWSGLLLALLLSTPYPVAMLAQPLEQKTVPDAAALRQAQAIVILAGGRRRNAPEYGGETVSALTLERVRYGARLARASGLPVLVSGGTPTGGSAEALLMRDTLEQDFGVRVRWTESASRDTAENAAYSVRILRDAGVQRAVLVTHAAHMKRAQAEFAAAGLPTVAAPTGFIRGIGASDGFFSALPHASTAYAGWLVSHEWLGGFAASLRQRFK